MFFQVYHCLSTIGFALTFDILLVGEDLPESHCLIAGRVLELRDLLKLTPKEECDVFQDNCPAGRVCCVSKKGHRCYPKHDEVNQQDRGIHGL